MANKILCTVGIISCILTAITTYTAIKVYCDATRYEAKLKQLELAPFPVISKMGLKKRECGNEPYVKRFYSGDFDQKQLSLDEQIDIINFDRNKMELRSLIDECLKSTNRNKVYFSRFMGNNCLVFNLMDPKSQSDDFFYEFCSTEVEIVNHGALINGVQIISVDVTLNNDDIMHLNGIANNKLECVIVENGTTKLTCDEVVNDFSKSLCINNKNKYARFDNSFDFLKRRLPADSLEYKKIKFRIKCWDLLNDSYEYDLTLESSNGFLQSYTKRL